MSVYWAGSYNRSLRGGFLSKSLVRVAGGFRLRLAAHRTRVASGRARPVELSQLASQLPALGRAAARAKVAAGAGSASPSPAALTSGQPCRFFAGATRLPGALDKGDQ